MRFLKKLHPLPSIQSPWASPCLMLLLKVSIRCWLSIHVVPIQTPFSRVPKCAPYTCSTPYRPRIACTVAADTSPRSPTESLLKSGLWHCYGHSHWTWIPNINMIASRFDWMLTTSNSTAKTIAWTLITSSLVLGCQFRHHSLLAQNKG